MLAFIEKLYVKNVLKIYILSIFTDYYLFPESPHDGFFR